MKPGLTPNHFAGMARKVAIDTCKGCLSCHEGIESIREEGSAMGLAIAEV
jgi:hypothetical protein